MKKVRSWVERRRGEGINLPMTEKERRFEPGRMKESRKISNEYPRTGNGMVLQDGLKPFFHLAPPPQLLKQFNDFLPATVFCIYTDRGRRRRGGGFIHFFIVFLCR